MASLTVGNKTSGSGYVAPNGTLTVSHTVASGTNRILLVGVAIQDITGTPNVSTVTYAGSAMTLVTNSKQVHTFEQVSWYYLLSPSTGANNIVVTIASAGEDANMIIGSADYSAHDGNAPVGNFKAIASSTTAINTGSISYTDGDVVVAMQVSGLNGATESWTNGTEWFDSDYSSMHSAGAAYTASGSGNVTITATASSSQARQAISAVRITPMAAAISNVSPASPKPGESVTVTLTGFASAPNTANSTYNGVSQTLDTASTTTVTLTWPALSTFVFGGSHAVTRWVANYTLSLGNGTETATATVQTAVPTLVTDINDFAVRAGTQYYAPPGSVDGDDFYVTWASGAGALAAAGAYFSPSSLPAQGQVRWYDVSAASWQALYLTDMFEASMANILKGLVAPIGRAIVTKILMETPS